MSFFDKFATDKNRWWALVVLALSLAIVIIDNTVLNVGIPYILRDLHGTLDGIQWVVSGYALIIATLLILMGRLGDIFGRRKVFTYGIFLFAVGSFLASISKSIPTLFIGESLIEAIGAAAMLTSSLSLLAAEFQGRERAIAFGIWGSVAGLSATVGPLLGGYFTTYHSWRWSLRINVIVAIIAILGTIFIKESKGDKARGSFDFLGTILSGLGLFSLVFGFIEAQKYGWWHAKEVFNIGSTNLSLGSLSIVPFAFLVAVILLFWFVWYERRLEAKGGQPILLMSMFRNAPYSFGLGSLGIISIAQFGCFFILPIFFQNVLGLTALQTGVVFLPVSLTVMVIGPLSGFIASKIGPKFIILAGMVCSVIGCWWLGHSLAVDATGWTFVPSMIVFGAGLGATSAQLTNVILSSVSLNFAGEASAANTTVRQVGTSIGIAIVGTILASMLTTNIPKTINADRNIPDAAKSQIISQINSTQIESGQRQNLAPSENLLIPLAIQYDVKKSLTDAVATALYVAAGLSLLGVLCTILIPNRKKEETLAKA